VDMPRVTSALEARQEGQVLEGLEGMGIPHMQQRTFTMVGLGVWVVVLESVGARMRGSSILNLVGGDWGVFCLVRLGRCEIAMVRMPVMHLQCR